MMKILSKKWILLAAIVSVYSMNNVNAQAVPLTAENQTAVETLPSNATTEAVVPNNTTIVLGTFPGQTVAPAVAEPIDTEAPTNPLVTEKPATSPATIVSTTAPVEAAPVEAAPVEAAPVVATQVVAAPVVAAPVVATQVVAAPVVAAPVVAAPVVASPTAPPSPIARTTQRVQPVTQAPPPAPVVVAPVAPEEPTQRIQINAPAEERAPTRVQRAPAAPRAEEVVAPVPETPVPTTSTPEAAVDASVVENTEGIDENAVAEKQEQEQRLSNTGSVSEGNALDGTTVVGAIAGIVGASVLVALLVFAYKRRNAAEEEEYETNNVYKPEGNTSRGVSYLPTNSVRYESSVLHSIVSHGGDNRQTGSVMSFTSEKEYPQQFGMSNGSEFQSNYSGKDSFAFGSQNEKPSTGEEFYGSASFASSVTDIQSVYSGVNASENGTNPSLSSDVRDTDYSVQSEDPGAMSVNYSENLGAQSIVYSVISEDPGQSIISEDPGMPSFISEDPGMPSFVSEDPGMPSFISEDPGADSIASVDDIGRPEDSKSVYSDLYDAPYSEFSVAESELQSEAGTEYSIEESNFESEYESEYEVDDGEVHSMIESNIEESGDRSSEGTVSSEFSDYADDGFKLSNGTATSEMQGAMSEVWSEYSEESSVDDRSTMMTDDSRFTAISEISSRDSYEM